MAEPTSQEKISALFKDTGKKFPKRNFSLEDTLDWGKPYWDDPRSPNLIEGIIMWYFIQNEKIPEEIINLYLSAKGVDWLIMGEVLEKWNSEMYSYDSDLSQGMFFNSFVEIFLDYGDQLNNLLIMTGDELEKDKQYVEAMAATIMLDQELVMAELEWSKSEKQSE